MLTDGRIPESLVYYSLTHEQLKTAEVMNTIFIFSRRNHKHLASPELHSLTHHSPIFLLD